MDDFKVKFSDALMPGIVISLVIIVLSLLLQFAVADDSIRQNLSYIVWILIFAALLYYGIQYRNLRDNNGLTYGNAFSYLFYIMVIFTIISTIFTYINYTIIDPDIVERTKVAAEDAIYDNPNITEDQIDKAIEMQAKFMTAGWLTFWGGLFQVIFAVFISLITAIFVKKNPTIVLED